MNAANRYIAGLYEIAIDRQLDLAQIAQHLQSHGLRRSLVEVRHDLESVYCFHGYSASHPPVPAQCVRAFDKAIDQGRA